MKELNRYHIRIRGRVQGVGFRAFVLRNARALGLTGWVRNVGYDQVETVAEGNLQILKQFEDNLRIGPSSSHVDEIFAEEEPATGEFDRFSVRYG
ncbi:MAG TPA: acylphosphatase [Anaerolineales bacterium]|nr:acylphosphatase [Anaerolineales bacterium]